MWANELVRLDRAHNYSVFGRAIEGGGLDSAHQLATIAGQFGFELTHQFFYFFNY